MSVRPLRSVSTAGARVKRVYYGWWVALAGAANMFVSSGPTFQASSVLFRSIQNEFGWSLAVVTGVASFGRFGGAMFGPIEGFLVDRFGSARMVLLGFTLGGVGLIMFSRVNSIPTYYISFFIISVGFSVGGFTPSMTAVNSWMPHRRATAMAIVIGGSSLGGLVVPAIVWGINSHGWRDTVLVIGLVTLAVGPIVSFVLARRVPEPKELKRLGILDDPGGRSRRAVVLGHDFTPREALHTRAFWAMSMTHTLTNLSVGALSAHIFLILTDENGVGLSDGAAGSVIPVMAGTAFAFQMTGGFLGDRVNKRLAISFLILMQAAGLVLLAAADSYLAVMIFAVVWGLGFGGRTPMLHALRGEYFGRRHFGTILGMSSFPMAIGMIITPVVVGRVFDVTGTYGGTLYFLAGAAVVASAVILLATRPEPPSRAGRQRTIEGSNEGTASSRG